MGNCCCCPDRGNGELLTDEVCGNFTIACGESDDVYFSQQPVTGTVSVFYDNGCAANLIVTVFNGATEVADFQVPNSPLSNVGNTRAVTFFEAFDRVQITCTDNSPPANACTGKFCITAHYPSS
ncbi:S-Ena type endospore appendage [Virgibacillus sp. Bac330]|uniref:S-Ena type endospore appendage n=1 Tax=Virgibacillus sp. Bac330 TaxID=2419841 RepID=UPI000EF5478D|nr:S-Ena type endospore appendage [Virgibacillus sp. Bac330]